MTIEQAKAQIARNNQVIENLDTECFGSFVFLDEKKELVKENELLERYIADCENPFMASRLIEILQNKIKEIGDFEIGREDFDNEFVRLNGLLRHEKNEGIMSDDIWILS